MDEHTEITGVMLGRMVEKAIRDEGVSEWARYGKARRFYRYIMRRVRKIAKVLDASPGKAPRYSYELAEKAIPDLYSDYLDIWITLTEDCD